ncbi:MAG: hypothetical protein V1846_05155 [Candidatus Komeilibacteria bacterium]
MNPITRLKGAIEYVFTSSRLSLKILKIYFTYKDKTLTYNVIVTETLSEEELEDLYVTQTEVLTHVESEVEFEENDSFVVNQIIDSMKSDRDYGVLVYQN